MKLNIETSDPQLTQWQRTTKLLPWLVLAVGLALTYFLQQAAFHVAHQSQQYDFDFQTSEIKLRIERRLTAYRQILKGAGGLFAASKSVERNAFREYVAKLRLSSSYPGVQGVGFSLVIPPQEKISHIEAIRKEGFPTYTVFPEGERGIYTPIIYMEPFTGRNLRAFGYDAFSDPVLRAGMDQARDLDQATISGKVSRLVKETGQQTQAGFVMFLAVYHNNRPRITTAERQANIFGWIYAPFRMDDLMFDILGERSKDIEIEIFDGENATPESLMYKTGNKLSLLQTNSSIYQTVQGLNVFGHPWIIKMRSLPVFEARVDTGQVAVIRLTGTLVSLLLSLLIWQLVNGRSRAIKLARNMTLELQESEYRWKFAIEGTGDGLWDWNIANNTQFFSKRWKEMLGFAEDEIGTSLDEWEKRIHPDDKANTSAAMQAYFDDKTPTYTCEYRFGCKDGNWKWILDRGMVVSRTKNGKPLRMIGKHSDITARKQTEEALLKEGALQKAIFNSANFSSIATDAKGVIQIFNVGAERMLGYTAADVIDKVTPADISDPQEVIARAEALSIELGTPIAPGFEALVFKASRGIEDIYELTYVRKDRSRFPAVMSVTALRDDQDAIIGYLLIGTDNTARKQAEEDRNRFFALSQDVLCTLDFDGYFKDLNPAWEKTLGYTKAELLATPFIEFVHPDDQQVTLAEAEKVSGGKALIAFENRYRCKDGSYRWFQWSVTPVIEDRMMYGVARDVTERKQEEAALLKAGALQNAIFNSANFSSIATDAKGVIQIFNVGAERMLGYVAADVMNKITPADISDPLEVIARARALSVELETPITPGFEALVFKASRGIEDIYELTYIRKDGSRFPAIVSVTALRDAQDAIIGYLLIGTDNTARKQIEAEQKKLDQRLRDQQFYTRSLIESNIDAIMTTDSSGIITDVNKQMEALTGCTRDELIGAPFKNYFTDPERAEAGIKLVLSEKKVTDYELTARSRDGKETVVSYNATTFYDRDRTLQGVFAAARDVTDRKIANDKLKEALNEKEMLLKEVYHRVKNNLQVVSSLINLQARNVKNEATAELLKQSADRIKAMALLHEKLYQSKDLARIDFNAYIHSLADHLLFGYGVHSDKIRVNIRIDDIFLDVDTAIPCGLIINELLSNALEHAFPDNRHGEIGITFTQDQGEFILVISDNGVGFPADLDYKKSASLGLQLVATLTNQLNGHMTLDRKDGSTFTISFTNTY